VARKAPEAFGLCPFLFLSGSMHVDGAQGCQILFGEELLAAAALYEGFCSLMTLTQLVIMLNCELKYKIIDAIIKIKHQ
jgi:hypothetical protein